MGVQEIGRYTGGTETAEGYIFVYEKKGKSSIGNRFCTHRTETAVYGVEFVSDRMSYIVLRGRWCDTVLLC